MEISIRYSEDNFNSLAILQKKIYELNIKVDSIAVFGDFDKIFEVYIRNENKNNSLLYS